MKAFIARLLRLPQHQAAALAYLESGDQSPILAACDEIQFGDNADDDRELWDLASYVRLELTR